jgi:hypothetical protein
LKSQNCSIWFALQTLEFIQNRGCIGQVPGSDVDEGSS